MSVIPEFELGLWNAWILTISYLLSFIVRYILYRLRGKMGSGVPITPARAH